ncbi:MAG: DNA mismatch repair endonuclease MutL, partial [Candidatus Lokiarchaeota archaeon]|nr:DNA mismatch repair endonuclease MutL [Candidatus Lokiarchaeota archaeon]
MQRIKKIKDFEKIAAGEVVERPASVVKELVENSIDAGAKNIKIIIKNAGKSLIQVIDDGYGIEKEDVEIAFDRYTSGKIEKFEDLDTLTTLGFRGEALSSIAVVSQVELITRTKNDDLGSTIVIHGGGVIEKKEISAPVGTNIKVKNLFYNIPARQKFLKTNRVELGHITDIITRYALGYPQIHFIYQHNDLDILNCPSSDDLKDMVFHIYGKETAKKMYPIDYIHPDGLFALSGLLGDPEISKKKRTSSSLFLNKRYVISDKFFEVIKDAYKGFLMVGRFPFFILNLDINPANVDFNIHPQKMTVRFNNEKVLFPFIENALRRHLEELFLPKKEEIITKPLETFIEEEKEEILSEFMDITSRVDVSLIAKEKASNIPANSSLIDSVKSKEMIQTKLITEDILDKKFENAITESLSREQYIITDTLPKMRPISRTGQLSNNVYILFESNDEDGNPTILIIDQHAASERIMKERFLSQYRGSKVQKQQLIYPLKINISPAERFFLKEHLSEINKFGFELEDFGGNTFILRAVPAIIEKLPKIDILKDMIEEIANIGKQQSFSDSEEEIINYLACHKSIRGGDYLTTKDIRRLVLDLSKCKDPYHCAHGRPTFRVIT